MESPVFFRVSLDPVPLRHAAKGITLIELIICISIIAILIQLAVPAFQEIREKWLSNRIVSGLLHTINFARHEAVTHGEYITLCPSWDGVNCASKSSADWSGQLIIFVDRDRNESLHATETLLRRTDLLSGGGRLSLSASGGKQYLQIKPDGLSNGIAGSFLYCPASGSANHAKSIVFSLTARAYSRRDLDHDGIVEDGSGDNVSC